MAEEQLFSYLKWYVNDIYVEHKGDEQSSVTCKQ